VRDALALSSDTWRWSSSSSRFFVSSSSRRCSESWAALATAITRGRMGTRKAAVASEATAVTNFTPPATQ
jgi:hypothetical protein